MRMPITRPAGAAAAAGVLAVLGLAGAGAAAAPASAATPARPVTAYVLNDPTCPGNTVTPIDTATNTALTAIKGTRGATAIAITPNGTTAYVTGYVLGTVIAIRTATNTISKVITLKPVGRIEISAIGITPDGTTAYLLNVIFEPTPPPEP